jgi:hypothetical protein
MVDGGIDPPGNQISLSVYSERWPIPKRTVHELTEDTTIGKELKSERVFRNAVVREIEVQLVMNIEVAKRIREWLDEKISKLNMIIRKLKGNKRPTALKGKNRWVTAKH